MEKTLEGVSMEIPMKCSGQLCCNCEMDQESDCTQTLAAEVQRLRDERETHNDLWKDAPETAVHMRGVFTNTSEINVGEFSYHRSIPKTLAQEIAEKYAEKYISDDTLKAKDLFLEAFAEYEARKEGGK